MSCLCRHMLSIIPHDLAPKVVRTGKEKSGNKIVRNQSFDALCDLKRLVVDSLTTLLQLLCLICF